MPHHELKDKKSAEDTVTYSSRISLSSIFIALIASFVSAVVNASPTVATSVIWNQLNNEILNEETYCLIEHCVLVKKEIDCDDEKAINKFYYVRNNRSCFTYTHELPRKKF